MRCLKMDEAQAELGSVVERGELVKIVGQEGETSVVMSYDQYLALQAARELLRNPDREEILAEHERVKRGEVEDYEAPASTSRAAADVG